MKKIIPFVAAVLVALSAQAQTVNVNLANGQTVKYNAGNVEDITFTERIAKPSEDNPEHFRAVDLGLPSGLLWASHNIGAKNYDDAGAYFAWGETSPKNEYGWGAYMWGFYDSNNKITSVNKYTSADGLTTLAPADDAATANWGDGWRMPTKEDFEELINNTNVRKVYKKDQDGNNTDDLLGLQFVSKKGDNKSIILPLTGLIQGHSVQQTNVLGYYWTSTLDENNDAKAYGFSFVPGAQGEAIYYLLEADSRPDGVNIRPVKAKE